MVYRKMNDSDRPAEARANLLIYVPRARGGGPEEWTQDPFAAFAAGGVHFGDSDAERLESIARQAMPGQADQITRMFAEGGPTLAMLDRLQQASSSPLLREAIGTESPSEAMALVLCDEAKAKRVEQVEGCTAELMRLLEARAGFKPAGKTRSFTTIQKQLGNYVLVSELALDLPQAMPDSLSAVPRATAAFKEVIYAACDRMRSDTGLRDTYVDLATRIEGELRLAEAIETSNLGQRDTFPFEERRYLGLVSDAAGKGDIAKAREIIGARRSSVWRAQGQRVVLWNAASRCVDLLAVVESIGGSWKAQAKDLPAVVSAYTREGGWAELDRTQRLSEYAIANCSDDSEITALVDVCRREYRELARAIQGRFLTLVQGEGWPPAGMAKQTQVFDRFVAPLLEKNAKVAYFMVDACRFEMGRDLGAALAEQGQGRAQTVAVAGALPAATDFGMAALLPGADQLLRIGEINGNLLPVLGQRVLRNLGNRMAVLKDRYGNRFGHVTLEDLLGKSRSVRELTKKADLLVVLTPDPDQIAEHLGNLRRASISSDTTKDITQAVRRLAEMGFQHAVIAADHGHILVDEILAGETVNEPGGDWKLRKRRCLLGKAHSREPGTITFKAAQLGMRGCGGFLCAGWAGRVPREGRVFPRRTEPSGERAARRDGGTETGPGRGGRAHHRDSL